MSAQPAPVLAARTALASPPRRLVGIADLSDADFAALLDLAAIMRRHPLAWRSTLEGRAVACLFERPSTRTRVSLEVAINRLGALPVMLSPAELQLAHGDTVADTAQALSAYADAVAVRTPRHRDLLELAEHASVPVVNLLTDLEHPCRALADCLALRDRFGDLDGLSLAYVGASDALANSLIEAAMLSGMEVRIAAPPALRPSAALLARAGASVRMCETPREAVSGAVAVYGTAAHGELPDAYAITSGLLSRAAPRAVFMHALPAARARERRGAAPDGARTLTGRQAANLLPVQQAVIRALVAGEWEV